MNCFKGCDRFNMKKVSVIILVIMICSVTLFWIAIETNPEIATKLGYASGPGKPVEVTVDTPNAMVPSIVLKVPCTERLANRFLQRLMKQLL